MDIFVAVGGDGTISTIAQFLIHTDKILGVFPAGSGNGFSNETQFRPDLDYLLNKIKNKESRLIDTFTVNGRLSINVSGIGFDGEVVKDFENTNRGFLNYVKISVATFLKFKAIDIRFPSELYAQYSGKYLMMNIANTRQFGNHAYIAPKASKSDGLLDVVLVKKFPLSYALKFAYRMFTKGLKSDQYVKYLKVSQLQLETNTSHWHLDGEYNRISSPIVVQVVPKSLRILK